MINKKLKYSILALILAFQSGVVYSKTDLSGRLGIDFENQSFKTSIKDPFLDYVVQRNLSNHFLSLNASGPVYKDNFASFTLSTRIDGSFYSVKSSDDFKSKYFTPRLNSYDASIFFLPFKPYSLALNINKYEKKAIRYEPSNRTETEVISPELAVVRRYQSKIQSYKSKFRATISRFFNFNVEYNNSVTEKERGYDFNEDRNIWVSFAEIMGYPASEMDTITVSNLIKDDSTMLYIDYALIDTIRPGEKITVVVDSGYHDVDIVPFFYNPYSNRVHVQRKMEWEIIYIQPAGVRDTKQDKDSFVSSLDFIGSENIENVSTFSYTSSFDEALRLDNELESFSNNFRYKFSRMGNISTETSINKNKTTIDTVSSRVNKTIMQKSAINWARRNGISTMFSHTYTRLNSKVNNRPFSNSIHNVASSIGYPIKRFHYFIDVKNDMLNQSDNTGYALNRFSTKISHAFDFQISRILFEPKNQTKIQFDRQKNPENKRREFENRFSLNSTVLKIPLAGRVVSKGEYQWRKRYLESGDEITKEYRLSISTTRVFNNKYKLGLTSSLRKETFGGSSPIPGKNPDQNSPARETQKGFSYGVIVEAAPVSDLSITGNVFVSKQNSTTAINYGMMISLKLPKLNIPLKTMINGQSRGLEGLPSQTQLIWESETSYRFRQIVFVLRHEYRNESLLREDYGYHEIIGKISRNFSIL
ncbi:MAG: hypothetical protein V3W18_00210 [candidate division Zixibacteria bacterium]